MTTLSTPNGVAQPTQPEVPDPYGWDAKEPPEPQLESTFQLNNQTPATSSRPPQPKDDKGRFLPAGPPQRHHPVNVQRARDLGISQADIDSYDVHTLTEVIYTLTKQQMADQRQARREEFFTTNTGERGPVAEVTKTPQVVLPGTPEESIFGMSPALFSRFEPEIQEAFKAAYKEVQEVKARTAEYEREKAAKAQHEEQSKVQLIDRFFNSIPEHFGTGNVNEIDANSDEAYRRQVFYLAVEADKSSAPYRDKIVRAAKRMNLTPGQTRQQKPAGYGYGQQPPQQPARPPANEFEQQWMNGSLGVPTQRSRTQPAGEDKATATLTRKLAEYGPSQGEGTSLDGFLP